MVSSATVSLISRNEGTVEIKFSLDICFFGLVLLQILHESVLWCDDPPHGDLLLGWIHTVTEVDHDFPTKDRGCRKNEGKHHFEKYHKSENGKHTDLFLLISMASCLK